MSSTTIHALRRFGDACNRLAIWAFALSLLLTLLSLVSYGLAGDSLPAFAGLPQMSPGFADLRQLTHAAGCGAAFAELLANTVNCDLWSRPFNYTEPSLHLVRVLGINTTNTPLIGLLLGVAAVALSVVFILQSVNGRARAYWLAAMFLGSFPFQLALERGNHDLLVLVGCLLIPALFLSRSAWMTPVLAFAVTALKLFPLVGLVPWSLLQLRRPRSRWLAAAILLGTGVGLAIQISDLPAIMANTPKSDGGNGFGLLASYAGVLGTGAAGALTLLKLALMSLSAAFCERRLDQRGLAPTQDESLSSSLSQQAALLMGTMVVIVYVISRSWDYRLIFGLGVLPSWLNSRPHDSQAGLPWLGMGLVFVGYEQYLRGSLGSAAHLLADVVIQPLLIGVLVAWLLNSAGIHGSSLAGLLGHPNRQIDQPKRPG